MPTTFQMRSTSWGGDTLVGGELDGLAAQHVKPVGGLVVHVVRQIGRLGSGAQQSFGLGKEVEDGGLVGSLFGPPSQGAPGLVGVPGDHARAAITREHSTE